MKKNGRTYQVVDGAGLDSGRVGRAVDPRRWRHLLPPRYRNFDARRETLLVDHTGRYFAMFDRYLREVR
jgi:hypothetical protein